MPKARRQDVYRLQGHALTDALGRCRGTLPRSNGYEAEWNAIVCPLCLGWFGFTELDEDHAPQRAGQSRLGRSQVVVMTCREDNQRAGKSFEGTVATVESLLAASPDSICRVHETVRMTESGLLVAPDPAPAELADVRAAFLVAFSALGYRWAASKRLDRLRSQLRAGDLRYAATDFELLCSHDTPVEPLGVYEIASPITAVLVVGTHAGVLLPANTSPKDIRGKVVRVGGVSSSGGMTSIQREFHASVRKRHPWPQQFVDPGGTAEKAWDEIHGGHLFHFDRCSEATHHAAHAMTPTEVEERLGPDAVRAASKH